MALLQQSTLFKLPIEARFMIFEYALEEFKSLEKQWPHTYHELLAVQIHSIFVCTVLA